MKTHYNFAAHIEKDKETGLYIGMVPSLSGAYTQATSLDELQSNLKEVIELCLEELSSDEMEDSCSPSSEGSPVSNGSKDIFK